jgi:hypothetical protein
VRPDSAIGFIPPCAVDKLYASIEAGAVTIERTAFSITGKQARQSRHLNLTSGVPAVLDWSSPRFRFGAPSAP